MKPDYKGFAEWCMREGPWAGCDLLGDSVQEAGVKFGIIKETKYDPKVHGPNEYEVEAGDPWFVFVEKL
jgi:hypothetical protein